MLIFDRYNQKILSYLLKSRKVLGEIVAYFGRVEFQGRGSPHYHMMVKCIDAPILGVDSIQDVIAYIDKYTSTYLPTEEHDVQLRNLVKLQVHKHTNTCSSKEKTCRFNYPRQVSDRTKFVDDNGNELKKQ